MQQWRCHAVGGGTADPSLAGAGRRRRSLAVRPRCSGSRRTTAAGNGVAIDRSSGADWPAAAPVQHGTRPATARRCALGTAPAASCARRARSLLFPHDQHFSHALGTVRMGDRPAHRSPRSSGRFRGLENLYVMDGSAPPDLGRRSTPASRSPRTHCAVPRSSPPATSCTHSLQETPHGQPSRLAPYRDAGLRPFAKRHRRMLRSIDPSVRRYGASRFPGAGGGFARTRGPTAASPATTLHSRLRTSTPCWWRHHHSTTSR